MGLEEMAGPRKYRRAEAEGMGAGGGAGGGLEDRRKEGADG